MKTFIAILIAAGVGFAGAYFYVGKQNEAKIAAKVAAAQEESAAKVEQLNADLAKANEESSRFILTAPAGAVSPKEVLVRLALIDPSTPELRTRKIREIIHHLETLVDAGTNAFQPIRNFLATGTDVNYTFDDGRPAGAPTFWNWKPGMELRSGLVLPPSLRISLVDVIRYIGGEGAEVSLAWMLSGSARGMEIPYVAQALEKMAPDRFGELGLQAASKYLMASSPDGSPADEAGRAYIFSWLTARGDTSMVAVARETVAKSPEKFNLEAARYLVNATQGEGINELAKTYNNNADSDTKNKIANLAFDYVGSQPAANAIFSDWILGSDVESAPGSISGRPREVVIRLLPGGHHGPFNANPPTDPKVIADRLKLLQELDPKLPTPRLRQASAEAQKALEALQAARGN